MTTARKVKKQFILDPEKIQRARKALNAKNDTETIDKALDLVLAEENVWSLMESLRGEIRIIDVYEEPGNSEISSAKPVDHSFQRNQFPLISFVII